MFLGVGLTLTGILIAAKMLSQRVHPDLKKVLQLRNTI